MNLSYVELECQFIRAGIENIWIDLNKLSVLGENSHTLNAELFCWKENCSSKQNFSKCFENIINTDLKIKASWSKLSENWTMALKF